MSKIEEVFENPILEDLYNIRTRGFQSAYEESYQKRKKIEEKKIELENVFKKLIKDEDARNKIIEQCEELLYEEKDYWNFAYYKLGICDGIFISRDIKTELERLKSNSQNIKNKNI